MLERLKHFILFYIFSPLRYSYWKKGECIIRYFGRPCDEFAERVCPIKISDGARVTLFNKGLVSCDVNQSFFNFAVWVRVCKLYDDILYILLSKILCDVTSSSSTSSLGIMRYCTAVDNRKDEKAWYKFDTLTTNFPKYYRVSNDRQCLIIIII
jgi:hypothetical protein